MSLRWVGKYFNFQISDYCGHRMGVKKCFPTIYLSCLMKENCYSQSRGSKNYF